MLRILEEALTFDDVLLVPAVSGVWGPVVRLGARRGGRRRPSGGAPAWVEAAERVHAPGCEAPDTECPGHAGAVYCARVR